MLIFLLSYEELSGIASLQGAPNDSGLLVITSLYSLLPFWIRLICVTNRDITEMMFCDFWASSWKTMRLLPGNLFLLTHPEGSQLPSCEDPRAAVVRSGAPCLASTNLLGLWGRHRGSRRSGPHQPSDDCSPGRNLGCNLTKDPEPESSNSVTPEFLIYKNSVRYQMFTVLNC